MKTILIPMQPSWVLRKRQRLYIEGIGNVQVCSVRSDGGVRVKPLDAPPSRACTARPIEDSTSRSQEEKTPDGNEGQTEGM